MNDAKKEAERLGREFADSLADWGQSEEEKRVRVLRALELFAPFSRTVKRALNLLAAAHNIADASKNPPKVEVVPIRMPDAPDSLDCPCPACVGDRAKAKAAKLAGPN